MKIFASIIAFLCWIALAFFCASKGHWVSAAVFVLFAICTLETIEELR